MLNDTHHVMRALRGYHAVKFDFRNHLWSSIYTELVDVLLSSLWVSRTGSASDWGAL